MTKQSSKYAISLQKRLLIYLAGIIILSLGITMNTKTNLGVSPIVSMPYSVSELTGLSLGALTFCFYMVFIFLQFLILRKDFEIKRLFQIVVSFLNSLFIDIFDKILPEAGTMPGRLALLAAAVVITGIGASLTVGMQLIAHPADSFAEIVGKKLGRDFGFGKNVFDLTSILISLTIGLVFGHRIIGIGIGTIIAMLFTGRVIALMQKPINRLMGTN